MASGDTLISFTPRSCMPPATDYATLDERGGASVLDFDDTTNEEAIFVGVMPQNYGGGGLTVHLQWSMASATTGDVDWDVKLQRQIDLLGDSYASAKSSDNNTVPGAAGELDNTSIAFTSGAEMDNIVAGDLFRLSVIRDAVSDTATGDAELVAVEIRET